MAVAAVRVPTYYVGGNRCFEKQARPGARRQPGLETAALLAFVGYALSAGTSYLSTGQSCVGVSKPTGLHLRPTVVMRRAAHSTLARRAIQSTPSGESYKSLWDGVLQRLGKVDPRTKLLHLRGGAKLIAQNMFIGLNPTIVETIFEDKKLSEVVAKEFNFVVVNTSLFVNYRKATSMKNRKLIWPQALQLEEDWGYPIVVKAIRGRGGKNIHLARNRAELWKLMQSFSNRISYIMQPFIDNKVEYRVILGPDGSGKRRTTLLVLKKVALEVTGDGSSTVEALLKAHPWRQGVDRNKIMNECKAYLNSKQAASKNGVDFSYTPESGEVVKCHWKNNQNRGAFACRVDPLTDGAAVEAEEFAVKIADRVGLNFGAVDMLATGDGFKFLELNSAVFTDLYDYLSPAESETALSGALVAYERMTSALFKLGADVVKGMNANVSTTPSSNMVASSVSDGSYEQRKGTVKEMLGEVGEMLNVSIRWRSMMWLAIIVAQDGRCCYRVQADQGANLDWTAALTNDKVVTYQVLHEEGVPAVPHIPYLYGTDAELSDSWAAIQKLQGDQVGRVIVKARTGGGGSSVDLCVDDVALEIALLKYLRPCVCPYEEIIEEYRVFQLGGEPLLVFKKERPTVVGDGSSTLQQLAENFIANQTQWGAKVGNGFLKKWKNDDRWFRELARVPDVGERVTLSWKHNLDNGCRPVKVPVEEVPKVIGLARKAANALRFAGAVDVIAVQEGGETVYKVMEVNSKPGLTYLPTYLPEDAKRIIEAYTRFALLARDLMWC